MSYTIYLYDAKVKTNHPDGGPIAANELPVLASNDVREFIKALDRYGYSPTPSTAERKSFEKREEGYRIEVNIFPTMIAFLASLGGESLFEALQDATEIAADFEGLVTYDPQTNEWIGFQ